MVSCDSLSPLLKEQPRMMEEEGLESARAGSPHP